jgi:hypothetical protein
MNEALLWTDGRYFLQATQQLSARWKLMRIGEDLPVEMWIAEVSIHTCKRVNSTFLFHINTLGTSLYMTVIELHPRFRIVSDSWFSCSPHCACFLTIFFIKSEVLQCLWEQHKHILPLFTFLFVCAIDMES